MPPKDTEYCTCCADVTRRPRMVYKFNNKLITLSVKTQKKKIPIVACPECDAPMIKQALSS